MSPSSGPKEGEGSPIDQQLATQQRRPKFLRRDPIPAVRVLLFSKEESELGLSLWCEAGAGTWDLCRKVLGSYLSGQMENSVPWHWGSPGAVGPHSPVCLPEWKVVCDWYSHA